jgi:hypothetical protein
MDILRRERFIFIRQLRKRTRLSCVTWPVYDSTKWVGFLEAAPTDDKIINFRDQSVFA